MPSSAPTSSSTRELIYRLNVSCVAHFSVDQRVAGMTSLCLFSHPCKSKTLHYLWLPLLTSCPPLCFADKVDEMTHAQKSSPVDMKIATIKPRPSSRCLVTQADINVSKTLRQKFLTCCVFENELKLCFCCCLFSLSSGGSPCTTTGRVWLWSHPLCQEPSWGSPKREPLKSKNP